VHKAEEIREAVEKLSFDKYPGLKVTISGGVASAEHDVTFDEVLQRADRALYNAKESGRNKIVAYSSLN
jgi:diguanylate cyclase (GGDEF)-like protein